MNDKQLLKAEEMKEALIKDIVENDEAREEIAEVMAFLAHRAKIEVFDKKAIVEQICDDMDAMEGRFSAQVTEKIEENLKLQGEIDQLKADKGKLSIQVDTEKAQKINLERQLKTRGAAMPSLEQTVGPEMAKIMGGDENASWEFVAKKYKDALSRLKTSAELLQTCESELKKLKAENDELRASGVGGVTVAGDVLEDGIRGVHYMKPDSDRIGILENQMTGVINRIGRLESLTVVLEKIDSAKTRLDEILGRR